MAAAKSPQKFNSFEAIGSLRWLLQPYVCGGGFGTGQASRCALTPDQIRQAAAMLLNICRADGGRITQIDYGQEAEIMDVRCLVQTGLLDEKELDELESILAVSGAYPNYYMYDHVGLNTGYINELGDRHSSTALLANSMLLDYVRNHCRMDDRTRKEIEHRDDGAGKTAADFVHSFRDNVDEICLGEATMQEFYALLYQGMPQWIANGNLRRAADCFIMTSDNTITSSTGVQGGYAGLDMYIGARPGTVKASWSGRGLVAAAAFYYDDPQYRWFSRCNGDKTHGCLGSMGGIFLPMHWDPLRHPWFPPPSPACAPCPSTSACTTWCRIRKRRTAGVSTASACLDRGRTWWTAWRSATACRPTTPTCTWRPRSRWTAPSPPPRRCRTT